MNIENLLTALDSTKPAMEKIREKNKEDRTGYDKGFYNSIEYLLAAYEMRKCNFI